MMDLFSSLNPNSSMMSMQMKWMSLTMIIMLLPNKMWILPSRMETMKNIISKSMNIKLTILIPLMLMIMMMNWFSIMPYIFSPSPHATLVFMIAFPLWLSTETKRISENMSMRIADFLPTRTPSFLIPMMIPIEMISLIIRPFTLTLRLSINITAGSLITTLVTFGSMTNKMIIMPQMILHILELSVSMIQAYVFVSLIHMYKKS